MTPDHTFPDDIMRDAAKWTAQCYQPKTGTWFDVRDVIASAILSERERCAEIARTLGVYPELNIFAGGPEWYRHGKDISKAILNSSALAPNLPADEKAVPPFNKRGTAPLSSEGGDEE
jgi:hypothetical protein